MRKTLPRYPQAPAVLIGRLARDVAFPGLGKLLLLDALSRTLRHSAEIAAAVVLVDAKDDAAKGFYARYGFHDVTQTGQRTFLPVRTIEKLLSAQP